AFLYWYRYVPVREWRVQTVEDVLTKWADCGKLLGLVLRRRWRLRSLDRRVRLRLRARRRLRGRLVSGLLGWRRLGRRGWLNYWPIVAGLKFNRPTLSKTGFPQCFQICLRALIVAASNLSQGQALHFVARRRFGQLCRVGSSWSPSDSAM